MNRRDLNDLALERQLRAHYASLTVGEAPGASKVGWPELLTASALGAMTVILVVAVATLLTPEPDSVGWDRQAVMSYLDPPAGALRRPEKTHGELTCPKFEIFA